jgi:hypothetical protein
MEIKPSVPPEVMATHALPEDDQLLAVIGRIALCRGQLDNALRMTVKDLAGVTKEETLDATARQGPRDLRERVRKLGRMRLGEGPALVRLDALLQRASRVTERRNQLLHSVWGRDIDGRGDYLRVEDHSFQPAPSVKELEELFIQLRSLLADFIDARFSGFLYEALKAKPSGQAHVA